MIKLIVIFPVMLFLCQFSFGNSLAVKFFSIKGLRLGMQLDEVVKQLNINNFKTSKDKFGLINGYEIVKQIDGAKTILNFTGNKRLYRIVYNNVYSQYKNRSMELYEEIKRKYGDPLFENIEAMDGVQKNIRSCWGATCTKNMPTTPALSVMIFYSSGKIKLTLSDNSIFKEDWKKYKENYNDMTTGGSKSQKIQKNQDTDF